MDETTAAPGPWLKWAWRYHVLGVEVFDTLEAAFCAAYDMQRDSDGVLECFEGPDGVVSTDEYEEYERARRERERARRDASPKLTAGVRIQGPDGEWAMWDAFTERSAAEAEVERLRPRFGDRVKVVDLPLSLRDV